MASKCYYCPALVTEGDKLPVFVGTKTEYVCVACDDRIVSYAQDEYEPDTYVS